MADDQKWLAWNFDLAACPMNTEVLLLWPQRELEPNEEDDELPTGNIVGLIRVLGERCGDDIRDNLSWSVPDLDNIPNAEFWGDDYENAFAPLAWTAPPALPLHMIARNDGTATDREAQSK